MDFKELKRKKERGISNEELMEQAKKCFIDADSIVVVGLNPDGIIQTYYTHESSLQVLGMMETAKNQLLTEMEV